MSERMVIDLEKRLEANDKRLPEVIDFSEYLKEVLEALGMDLYKRKDNRETLGRTPTLALAEAMLETRVYLGLDEADQPEKEAVSEEEDD